MSRASGAGAAASPGSFSTGSPSNRDLRGWISGAGRERSPARSWPRGHLGWSSAAIAHPGNVAFARQQVTDPRATFVVAELPDVPLLPGGFDAVVAGFVLNFLPAPAEGVAVLTDRARAGGIVAAHVWDYADGMQLMRTFDDYWTPFLSGQGPAPGYVMSLSPARRARRRRPRPRRIRSGATGGQR